MKRILLLGTLVCLGYQNLFASERTEQMRAQKSVILDRDSKFSIFRDGNKTRESLADVEGKYAYCAVENIKLAKIKWKKKQDLVVRFKKMEFPNSNIVRYSLVENEDYNIFCDFTATTDFVETDLVKQVNRQFKGWFRIRLSI